ncbi:hypothetical protein KBC31_02355 [Candidatus Saccharibacteria bacterium]|nr:hypothetical protein [Candidatus Saccharibacteria bacterium]
MNKVNLLFIAKSTVIYSLAYLVVGGIAYQLITKQFYIGEEPIFTAFMRNEANVYEWAHVNLWLLPGLLLRGLLISTVISFFRTALKDMSFKKRVGLFFLVIFILTHFAAAAPSPSNIEGLVYMKPELISLKSFLLTQPEMIAQSLLFALGLSWILNKPKKKIR